MKWNADSFPTLIAEAVVRERQSGDKSPHSKLLPLVSGFRGSFDHRFCVNNRKVVRN
jgi:hypothetical protein